MGFTACRVNWRDGGNGGDIYPYNHIRERARNMRREATFPPSPPSPPDERPSLASRGGRLLALLTLRNARGFRWRLRGSAGLHFCAGNGLW